MVETLIYVYLAVCFAMILFNIACICVFHRRDKKLVERSKTLIREVEQQIRLGKPDEAHRKYLTRKLRHVNHLMAFDETLDRLYPQYPQEIRQYIEDLMPVIVYLTMVYRRKNKLQAAYFPYIIKKYGIMKGQRVSIVVDAMLELVREDNLYCRENALQALYTIGDADSILTALKLLDHEGEYYHPKMLTDGLLEFSGDRTELNAKLWQNFFSFHAEMQVTLLNYFRFSSGDYQPQILQLMQDASQADEVRYSCIRYFGRYPYAPALPLLYDFAEKRQPKWEYMAIAATSLVSYPGEKTVEVLKSLLSDSNWYVRYNAAESLERLGLDYEDLIDILEGGDRYASEMLRYRFDRKKLKKKEAVTA